MDTTRASLLIRIREAEDRAAWAEFDAIYRPMLYRFAIARGVGHADAEDVVQHCMTAIQKHIRGFEYEPRKGRFKGWLRTMVNNRVRNLLRDRREQTAETRDFQRANGREAAPEDDFDRVWMEEHLRHCLRSIREEVDAIAFAGFHQYVIKEQPVEAVCESLGISRNQLYKIKWRLTRTLGQKMKELVGDDD